MQQDLQDDLILFVLRYFLSVLMDGLTFTQTKGAPFGQGDLNVLPMHELTVAIAACGLCTDCEGCPMGEPIPHVLRGWRPQQRAENPQDWLRTARRGYRGSERTWPVRTIRATILCWGDELGNKDF